MDNKNIANKIVMDSADRAAVIIGLGYLALFGVIFWLTLTNMHTAEDFRTVWIAVGPILGVIIGAMPAHFFRSMAQTANARADGMVEHMAGMAQEMADMGKQMANMGADSK